MTPLSTPTPSHPLTPTTPPSQFERSLLRWLEYPPDANHGFYIPSATVTARCGQTPALLHPPPPRLADCRNCSLSLGLEDSTMAHVVWGNPAQPTTLVRSTGRQPRNQYTIDK